MPFNEMNILFIVNVIFVLILNLNDYKSSIVLEFKSFFETHVYTVLPPIFQIFVSTFGNALFDFLLMNENINKSIENLYTKSNLSTKAKENGNVLMSTSVFALSIFMYLVEVCLHFALLSMFFIYIKQIISLLTNIDEASNSEQKTKAYLLIFIGFVFYRVIKFLVNINYKVTFQQFIMYCMSFCIVIGISFATYYCLYKFGNEKDIEFPNENINENMKHFISMFKNFMSFFPTILVGLFGIYIGLTIMFVFYDILFGVKYNKIKEQKRKIFYTLFIIIFGIAISSL